MQETRANAAPLRRGLRVDSVRVTSGKSASRLTYHSAGSIYVEAIVSRRVGSTLRPTVPTGAAPSPPVFLRSVYTPASTPPVHRGRRCDRRLRRRASRGTRTPRRTLSRSSRAAPVSPARGRRSPPIYRRMRCSPECAVRPRYEARTRVWSTERWIRQLHEAAVVEHQPSVAVLTAGILEPLERPVVARRVVVVEHDAATARGEP